MSSTRNTTNAPDAITLAFWRAAEVGDLAEIEALLPRLAEVNARNEHGVTALMRAAQHGHASVVSLLLAKGADANIIRHDKFTALSLAAFFGHTEVVRVLMEHGADSRVSTRHGTSPHMWATARTFNEVVDQLKNPAGHKREERAANKRLTPAPPVTPARPVPVRTLKDPPEIWDLVHEAPRGFNARSAFVTRLRSIRLTFRIATAAGLIGACVVGVLVLRGVHARSETTAERQVQPANPVVKVQSENPAREHVEQPAVESPAGVPSAFIATPVPPIATEDSRGMRRSSHSRMVRSQDVDSDAAAPTVPVESVQRTETAPEKSDTKVRPDTTSQPRSSSPLSPQLITPAKNASPKTKVIQWP